MEESCLAFLTFVNPNATGGTGLHACTSSHASCSLRFKCWPAAGPFCPFLSTDMAVRCKLPGRDFYLTCCSQRSSEAGKQRTRDNLPHTKTRRKKAPKPRNCNTQTIGRVTTGLVSVCNLGPLPNPQTSIHPNCETKAPPRSNSAGMTLAPVGLTGPGMPEQCQVRGV